MIDSWIIYVFSPFSSYKIGQSSDEDPNPTDLQKVFNKANESEIQTIKKPRNQSSTPKNKRKISESSDNGSRETNGSGSEVDNGSYVSRKGNPVKKRKEESELDPEKTIPDGWATTMEKISFRKKNEAKRIGSEETEVTFKNTENKENKDKDDKESSPNRDLSTTRSMDFEEKREEGELNDSDDEQPRGPLQERIEEMLGNIAPRKDRGRSPRHTPPAYDLTHSPAHTFQQPSQQERTNPR